MLNLENSIPYATNTYIGYVPLVQLNYPILNIEFIESLPHLIILPATAKRTRIMRLTLIPHSSSVLADDFDRIQTAYYIPGRIPQQPDCNRNALYQTGYHPVHISAFYNNVPFPDIKSSFISRQRSSLFHRASRIRPRHRSPSRRAFFC